MPAADVIPGWTDIMKAIKLALDATPSDVLQPGSVENDGKGVRLTVRSADGSVWAIDAECIVESAARREIEAAWCREYDREQEANNLA